MKPNEHNPNGYKVVCLYGKGQRSTICLHTYRYKVAKRYKDKWTALGQRSKYKYRYYILPLTKKDKREWRSLPF